MGQQYLEYTRFLFGNRRQSVAKDRAMLNGLQNTDEMGVAGSMLSTVR